MNTFGDKMKALREDRGWTQKLTAEKMEVSPQMYSNYERNKTNPSLEILKRVCDLYNISLDTLNGDFEDLSEFLYCVQLDNSNEGLGKTFKESDEEIHYLIPSLAGIGLEPLVHSDLYNDKIDYKKTEYFFFKNKDIEYSPGRLKAGDLLYCEGIDPDEDPDFTTAYLIYSETKDKYYVRKSINPNLIIGILKGLKDEEQKEGFENLFSTNNIEDYLFLLPDLPTSQSMLILKKKDVKIVGQIRYVIYSPMIDLYENAGIDYRALVQEKWENETLKFQEKIKLARQNNPDFLKE